MDYSWLATMLIQVRKWLGHLSDRTGQEKRQNEKDYEEALTAWLSDVVPKVNIGQAQTIGRRTMSMMPD